MLPHSVTCQIYYTLIFYENLLRFKKTPFSLMVAQNYQQENKRTHSNILSAEHLPYNIR